MMKQNSKANGASEANRTRRALRYYEGLEHNALRQARESAGLAQEELARRLKTKKSSISRIENHADDVRLSTLRRYAGAVGANLQIRLANS